MNSFVKRMNDGDQVVSKQTKDENQAKTIKMKKHLILEFLDLLCTNNDPISRLSLREI